MGPQDGLALLAGKYNMSFGGARWPRLGNVEDLRQARGDGCVVAASRSLNLSSAGCQLSLASNLGTFIDYGLDFFWNTQLDSTSPYLTSLWHAQAQLRSMSRAQRAFGMAVAVVPGLAAVGYASTGDAIEASWDGLQQAAIIVLTAALAGQPYVAPQIGGAQPLDSLALLVRFYQLAALLPMMRLHLPVLDPNRLPMSISNPDMQGLVLEALQLRYRLLPLLYSHHLLCSAMSGMAPLLQPMAAFCPQEASCTNLITQWVLADVLLVAPAFNLSGAQTVYLPRGPWYIFNSTTVLGPGAHSRVLALNDVAAYVPQGSLVVLGDGDVASTNSAPQHPLQVHVYAGHDATLLFVEDDGRSMNSTQRQTMLEWDDDLLLLQWNTTAVTAPQQ